MRTFIIIQLISLSLLCVGQTDSLRYISIDDALQLALQHNPTALNDAARKALIRDVKSTYYHLVLVDQKMKILRDQLNLIGDLRRVARLRYETGDIDLLEKTILVSRLNDVSTSASVLSDEMAILRNQLKIHLFEIQDLYPADTVLTMYKINKDAPPADPRPADTDDYSAFVSDLTLENLKYTLNVSFKKLRHFETFALETSGLMLDTAKTRLQKEEIDYCEFIELVDSAFAIKLEYLDTLDKYNQTAIQLEFYAY